MPEKPVWHPPMPDELRAALVTWRFALLRHTIATSFIITTLLWKIVTSAVADCLAENVYNYIICKKKLLSCVWVPDRKSVPRVPAHLRWLGKPRHRPMGRYPRDGFPYPELKHMTEIINMWYSLGVTSYSLAVSDFPMSKNRIIKYSLLNHWIACLWCDILRMCKSKR